MNRLDAKKALLDYGIVGVIRTQHAEQVPQVFDALVEGGIRAIELTTTIPGVLPILKKAIPRYGNKVVFGLGTVYDRKTAEAALDAGAAFIVSPVLVPELLALGKECDRLIVPGALTPTEIWNARTAGADIVKIFPASTLGPPALRAILAPMPDLLAWVTGGITSANASEWLKAGAKILGFATDIADPKLIERRDYPALTDRARRCLEAARPAPKS